MPHLHINEKTGISLHKLLLSCKGEALTDSAALHGVNTTSKYLCHLNGFYFYLPLWFHSYWLVVFPELLWQTLQLQGQALREFPKPAGHLRCRLGFGVGSPRGTGAGQVVRAGSTWSTFPVIIVLKIGYAVLKTDLEDKPFCRWEIKAQRGNSSQIHRFCPISRCDSGAQSLELLGFSLPWRMCQSTLTSCH